MPEVPINLPDDESAIRIIGHILFRDAETGEIILERRDAPPPAPSAPEDGDE